MMRGISARMLAAIATASLLVATPVQAGEGCEGCDEEEGDVIDGDGQSSQDAGNDTSADSALLTATSTTSTGPCEIIIYDTSRPGSYRIDPDGCITSLIEGDAMEGL